MPYLRRLTMSIHTKNKLIYYSDKITFFFINIILSNLYI